MNSQSSRAMWRPIERTAADRYAQSESRRAILREIRRRERRAFRRDIYLAAGGALLAGGAVAVALIR
jgi:hypothetical protein